MMNEEYMILASSRDKPTAQSIADKLDIPIGDIEVKQEMGTETSVDVESYVTNKTIFLIYNLNQPTNESLMQLLFACDAIKKEGAKSIYLITSYLPYTKIMSDYSLKLNFSLVARFFEEVSINRIYTFGLYNPRITYYTKIPTYNIPVSVVFGKVLEDNFASNKNIIVSCIDHEMQETSREVAKKIGSKTIFPTKELKNGKQAYEIHQEINGLEILLISDSINSGENLIPYVNYLTYKGARNISVICTHGILKKEAVALIEKSVIKQIYTLTHNFNKSDKIKVIPATKIIEEIIKRTIENKSIKSILK